MRHQLSGRRLGRASGHRSATLSNLVVALLTHERITTTSPRAKEVRRLAERVITLGKTDSVHARRLAFRVVKDRSVVKKVFDELGPRFAQRPGGYTRILKTGFRHGDNADMAILELVERVVKPPPEPKKDSGKKEPAAEPKKKAAAA